jgi:hypothetical protein
MEYEDRWWNARGQRRRLEDRIDMLESKIERLHEKLALAIEEEETAQEELDFSEFPSLKEND